MNDLTIIENLKPLEVFVNNGLDPIISKIEKEARSYVLDISTEKGRKQIASLAYKIAQSKTALDDLGKNLTEEWKTKSKAVDAERKRMREKLDALKEEIREPLTEWENAEKERISGHEARLLEIEETERFILTNWQTIPLIEMEVRQRNIMSGNTDWQEFAVRAERVKEQAVTEIAAAIQKREAYDAEQAELARLRQEEADRKHREHEERLKAETAAKAKAEAEATAKAEADALAAKVAAEQKAATEREEAIKREKAEAEERAKKAEDARKAAEAKAKADQAAAEERAAQRERERIEAEQRAEAEAAAKREADKKHRARINNEALYALNEIIEAFQTTGNNPSQAIVEAIARGKVPHVKIQY